jgi:hypothetical protein
MSTDSIIFLALDLKDRRYSIFWEINCKMTRIRNYKTKTALVAITTLASLLLVSTSATGTGHTALADDDDRKVSNNNHYGSGSSSSSSSGSSGLADGSNTGINVPTDTNQKQSCETAGETSQITKIHVQLAPLMRLPRAAGFSTSNHAKNTNLSDFFPFLAL